MNLELSCSMQLRDPQLADVAIISGQLRGFLRDHAVSDDRFLFELDLADDGGARRCDRAPVAPGHPIPR